MVKNPSSNAGDTGSIPGQGTKIPLALAQLSWCFKTRTCASRGGAPQQEKPPQ